MNRYDSTMQAWQRQLDIAESRLSNSRKCLERFGDADSAAQVREDEEKLAKIKANMEKAERALRQAGFFPDPPCAACKDLPLREIGSCNKGFGICAAYLSYQALHHEGGNH